MAVLSALAFVLAPQTRLWNARLLPFWFLTVYLLAGLGVSVIGEGIAALFGHGAGRRSEEADVLDPVTGNGSDGGGEMVEVAPYTYEYVPTPEPVEPLTPVGATETGEPEVSANERWLLAITPLVALFVFLSATALPFGILPDWYPIKTADSSFVTGWARWNYEGYERKVAYPEYRDVVTTMDRVGKERGCGRSSWEYEPELDRFGTPMALMLLPYWTHGCIGSMEGLYFESSATTPYHFLSNSELSLAAAAPAAQPALPRPRPEHRRAAPPAVGRPLLHDAVGAGAGPGPRAPGPHAGRDHGQVDGHGHRSRASQRSPRHARGRSTRSRTPAVVAPLKYEPAVMTKVPKGGSEWQDAARRVLQTAPPSRGACRWPPVVPRSGRGSSGPSADAPRKAVKPATVSNIDVKQDRISFDVDRVGVPVLVKTSYFPNWKASGAKGPWRVTPNQMVVIPTSKHVSMHYGNTPVDLVAWAMTYIAAIGLIVLAVRERRARRAAVDGDARRSPRRGRASEPVASQPEPQSRPNPCTDRGMRRTTDVPRRSPLLDRHRQRGDPQARPLDAEHELGVEEVRPAAARGRPAARPGARRIAFMPWVSDDVEPEREAQDRGNTAVTSRRGTRVCRSRPAPRLAATTIATVRPLELLRGAIEELEVEVVDVEVDDDIAGRARETGRERVAVVGHGERKRRAPRALGCELLGDGARGVGRSVLRDDQLVAAPAAARTRRRARPWSAARYAPRCRREVTIEITMRHLRSHYAAATMAALDPTDSAASFQGVRHPRARARPAGRRPGPAVGAAFAGFAGAPPDRWSAATCGRRASSWRPPSPTA